MAPSGNRFSSVDDDPDIRAKSLAMLLDSSGYSAKAFEVRPGVPRQQRAETRWVALIVDIRMPDMDGLQLQRELVARRSPLPVIVMTGHGDIAIAVQAMKAGARGFPGEAVRRYRAAGKRPARARTRHVRHQTTPTPHSNAQTRMAELTDRERPGADLIVAGKANKVMPYELSISAAHGRNPPLPRDGKDGCGESRRPCPAKYFPLRRERF